MPRICPDLMGYGVINFLLQPFGFLSRHYSKLFNPPGRLGMAPRAAESATKRYICFSLLALMKCKLHKDLIALLAMGLVLLILFIFFR